MRFPYVVVLGGVLVAAACARGEDIPLTHVAGFDAGLIVNPDETGGAGGGTGMNGGSVGAGGDGNGGGTEADGGATSSTGGEASGGSPASGGTSSATGGKSGGSGGTIASGGTAAGSGGKGTGGKSTGGTSGAAGMGGQGGSCQTGQKSCPSATGGAMNICTPPAPRVGCGLTGCDPCTLQAPPNGYVTCTNNQCAFDCLSGYTKMGSTCVGSGAGGGGSGNCNPVSCPQSCSVVLGPACCTTDGKCGCPLVPWVAPTCVATK